GAQEEIPIPSAMAMSGEEGLPEIATAEGFVHHSRTPGGSPRETGTTGTGRRFIPAVLEKTSPVITLAIRPSGRADQRHAGWPLRARSATPPDCPPAQRFDRPTGGPLRSGCPSFPDSWPRLSGATPPAPQRRARGHHA